MSDEATIGRAGLEYAEMKRRLTCLTNRALEWRVALMNEAKRLGGEALSTIPGGDRVQVQQLPSYSDIDGVLEEIQTLKGNMTRKAKILRDLGLPVSE